MTWRGLSYTYAAILWLRKYIHVYYGFQHTYMYVWLNVLLYTYFVSCGVVHT
jgi:hypothetical protein